MLFIPIPVTVETEFEDMSKIPIEKGFTQSLGDKVPFVGM